MWSLKAFRHLSFAGALHAFVGYGVALFLPSFFMRIHGFGLAETSTYLFNWSNGDYRHLFRRVSGRSIRANRSALVHVYPWSSHADIRAVCGAFLFHRRPRACLFLAIRGDSWAHVFGANLWYDADARPASDARNRISAYAFHSEPDWSWAGSGLCGRVKRSLRPEFGIESIRYSLLILAVAGNLWSAVHYYFASLTLREDLKRQATL